MGTCHTINHRPCSYDRPYTKPCVFFQIDGGWVDLIQIISSELRHEAALARIDREGMGVMLCHRSSFIKRGNAHAEWGARKYRIDGFSREGAATGSLGFRSEPNGVPENIESATSQQAPLFCSMRETYSHISQVVKI